MRHGHTACRDHGSKRKGLIVNALAPLHRGPRFLLAGAAISSVLAATGCDKAKEEPAPTAATVIMPGTPAPTDAAASSNAPPVVAGTGPLPTAADAEASNRINAGTSAPATGGTISVIPAPAPASTTIVIVNPPNGTTAPSVAPGPNVSVLPPAISASVTAPGSIGPNPSTSTSGNDQPPSYAPGTPPATPR
jgi:hypothetical protein